MCWISSGVDSELVAGTKRYVSPAYLWSQLAAEVGRKLEAVKAYYSGPKAEP